MKKTLLLILLCGACGLLTAQSLTDGIFMDKKFLCAGVMYSNDTWKEYWEGSLLRENGNIGTITTQSAAIMANYGLLDNLNLIAMVPYVWTKASAGTLTGLQGIQDLTMGVKYKPFKTDVGGSKLSLQVVAGGSVPLTNYTPDLLPLSIGLHSNTLFGRGILHFYTPSKLSFLVSGAYLLRGNVDLDRSSYYTTQQINSSEVDMPNAAQVAFRGGYYSYRWQAELLAEQNMTLGGFDIRRQDMPFISNDMDAFRVGVNAAYRLPFLADIQLMGTAMQTLSGRNVGKSLSWMVGLTKFIGFGVEEDENATDPAN